MKIGIFTNNYLPNPYGVSVSVESFRKQFESRGHEVYIFAPAQNNYKDKNPNVFRYRAIDINFNKIRFPVPFPYSSKAKNYMKNLKLDIIHSQHPNLLGWVAKRWSIKNNIPIIFTWHTLYEHYTHYVPFIPKRLANRWVVKNAVNYANSADQVIIPTDSVQSIIKKSGVTNKNIAVVPTGVEIEKYVDIDPESIRKKYKINDNETLMLSAGRLTGEKNVEFLIKVVIEIINRSKGIKFLFVGGGNLTPKLEDIVKKEGLERKIIFTGVIPNEELKHYYSACDIFLYTSKTETQGLVVTEAMYMGVPIVALRATGINNLVRHGVNGYLVSENKEEFIESVEKIINNAELKKLFSKASKDIAMKNYTGDVCASKILEVYSDAIQHKNIARNIGL